MKKSFLPLIIVLMLNIVSNSLFPQPRISGKFTRLPFGSIKPSGWIREQMKKDMDGFVGNLDRLVPDLINDPIYDSGRLHKQSRSKDLGNLKSGDAEGDEQYKWWNSETQSNWWDGYIRNALLLNDSAAIEKIRMHVARILASQDVDGYLGIYEPDLRYNFKGENGELWAKTTLLRGLLAWYEYTNDRKIWDAIVKAVDNVMLNYPVNTSNPFFAGKDFSGGVAHGLTFTDILDRMYHLTGELKYWNYAAFLYRNFSENHTSETDAQIQNILDSAYRLKMHGVHTYEHLRPLIIAAYATGDPKVQKALNIYLERIEKCTTVTGGAIGDEWIGGRTADATLTGYEYCSLHELMDSYTLLLQKSGDLKAADKAETIFYNAAQGSRDPGHSCIAYLKTDNSYEMMGTRNGEEEPGRKQTRYKYSPAHQDVAVCCAPNAGRITPYFLQACWMKEDEQTLVAAVLSPTILQTAINDIPVRIEEITEYPYQNHFVFNIQTEKPVQLRLKIRQPAWATSVKTAAQYQVENGFLVFDRNVTVNDRVELDFQTDVRVLEDQRHEKYFAWGALLYVVPIPSAMQTGRVYISGFEDLYYQPKDSVKYAYIGKNNAVFENGKLQVTLKNETSGKDERIELTPLSKTILRQTSFR